MRMARWWAVLLKSLFPLFFCLWVVLACGNNPESKLAKEAFLSAENQVMRKIKSDPKAKLAEYYDFGRNSCRTVSELEDRITVEVRGTLDFFKYNPDSGVKNAFTLEGRVNKKATYRYSRYNYVCTVEMEARTFHDKRVREIRITPGVP